MADLRKFIEILDHGNFQHDQDSYQAFSLIADGSVSKEEIKKFLLKINQNKINSQLIFGAVKAFAERMVRLKAPENTIDVCGTGGDGLNSLNISTAVCFAVAACGISVAKHGNRAVSSKSGSADIFLELGIDISQSIQQTEESLFKNNLAFIFAPLYHSSFKNVAEVRKELGVKTIFNYLGPLLNPAQTKYQLIGCSNQEIAQSLIEVTNLYQKEKCYVVTGKDGMDEISLSADSVILKMDQGKIYQEEIFNPENYGFKKVSIDAIKGGSPKYNAQKLVELLKGEESAYKDIVVLNSALAITLIKNIEFKDAIYLANEAIVSGKAYDILKKLQITKSQ
jgi:anthranilate phosphoribosyltransferase